MSPHRVNAPTDINDCTLRIGKSRQIATTMGLCAHLLVTMAHDFMVAISKLPLTENSEKHLAKSE